MKSTDHYIWSYNDCLWAVDSAEWMEAGYHSGEITWEKSYHTHLQTSSRLRRPLVMGKSTLRSLPRYTLLQLGGVPLIGTRENSRDSGPISDCSFLSAACVSFGPVCVRTRTGRRRQVSAQAGRNYGMRPRNSYGTP